MNPTRRELLELIRVLSEKYPEMRLGQLVSNFASLVEGGKPEAVYDVEDEAFIAGIRKHLERNGSLEMLPRVTAANHTV